MRCYCCNRNLSDYESTLRHPETGEFLDTCRKCLSDIPIEPLEGKCPENSSYYDETEDEYDDPLLHITDDIEVEDDDN